MVRLARPVSLIRAATQHAERVYAVAQGAAVAVPLTLTVSLNRTGFGLTSTGGHAPFAGIAVLAPAKLTYDH